MEDTKSNDIDERFKQFKEEYEQLTKKYGIDFQSYPEYAKTTGGFFVTVCIPKPVDLRKDVVSPIQIIEQE